MTDTQVPKMNAVKIYRHCTILTMDPKNTVAEAMAVFKGNILTIGPENEVCKLAGQLPLNADAASDGDFKTVDVDLQGNVVLPGFIDAHMHPGFYVYFKTQLNLNGVQSYADLERAIREGDRALPPGEWLIGIDFMENTFLDPAERVYPDRFRLDRMCPTRPLVIIRHDGHICGVNSATLQAIGISKANLSEKKVLGGEIRVDNSGEPTGIFTETAAPLVMDSIPIPSAERLKRAAKGFSEELASYGVTTCGAILQTGERGPGGKAGAMELPLLQACIKDGLLLQDFTFYLITDRPKTLPRYTKAFQKLNTELGQDRQFTVGGVKIYVDGTFGACTAAMFESFADCDEDTKGFLVIDETQLRGIVKEAYDLGFQVACHAIGDRANRVIVDIYRDVAGGRARPAAMRIEHASVLTPDTIKDAAETGIVLACQPSFLNSEYTWLLPRLGVERCQQTYPFRSILDAGIPLAGATDAPVESPKILPGIQACVTRNGFVPEQAITVLEAIRMFTASAAFAIGQGREKGSLQSGKRADFIVLGADPRNTPPESIGDIPILATYRRGEKIYSK